LLQKEKEKEKEKEKADVTVPQELHYFSLEVSRGRLLL
jgi:hypothetical protein